MAEHRIGRQTIVFDSGPALLGWASVVGKKEGQGPLSREFDIVSQDTKFGQDSWEKAESQMQKEALQRALQKAFLVPQQLDLLCAGDLLNQCISSNYAVRGLGVPFLGLYGACSTMAESLLLAAAMVDGGFAGRAAAMTSSHLAAAERLYRLPLEYGGQRTPTAQWTVTGAGCVILGREGGSIRVRGATVGAVIDKGINDANTMGSAMAPAAYETLRQHLSDTGRGPEDYDLIVTGDLGQVGSEILRDLFRRDGVELGDRYNDCGLMIFDRERQDVHAGGSGCGCAGSVLCGPLLGRMARGELRRILLCATGALMSPLATQQGESIPAICHAVEICKEG